MRKTITSHRRTSILWPVLTLLAPAVGCNTTAPTTPSPSPSRSDSSLTTVFLLAPAMAPVSATDTLVGRYTLEIDARSRSGQDCELVPESATRRTYTADIHRVVKLYDAFFLADAPTKGYGCLGIGFPEVGFEACHQFSLTGDPDSLAVNMTAPDDWRENEIWEALPDGFVLEVWGRAAGRAQNRRIEAAGTGGLWYGNGLPASTAHACRSDDLRLTFTPR